MDLAQALGVSWPGWWASLPSLGSGFTLLGWISPGWESFQHRNWQMLQQELLNPSWKGCKYSPAQHCAAGLSEEQGGVPAGQGLCRHCRVSFLEDHPDRMDYYNQLKQKGVKVPPLQQMEASSHPASPRR